MCNLFARNGAEWRFLTHFLGNTIELRRHDDNWGQGLRRVLIIWNNAGETLIFLILEEIKDHMMRRNIDET